MTALEVALIIAWSFALVTTVLNLSLLPRLRPAMPRAFPKVSVVIPARNEERSIEQTVRAMLAQGYPALEVVVVDDRSDDRTGAILHSIDDPRLVVVDGAELPPGWLGKPWAIDQGSRRASGELLLIVDADVVYGSGAIGAAVSYMEAHPGVALISLFPHLEMRGFWELAGLTQLPITGLMLIPVWLGNYVRTPRLGIGGGPGAMIRRSPFDAIGGYTVVRDAVVDDIGFVREVRAAGHQTRFVLADDFLRLRMYHGLREVVHGFTKNGFSALGRSYPGLAIMLVLMFVFHIFPYFAAPFMKGALVAVGLITLARLILFIRMRYSVLAALFLHPVTMLLWTWIMLRSAWVTGIRGRLEWRGRTLGKWSKYGR